jgi:hypothetical protein
MSNLDDTIGNLLLDLQRDDPDTFKKIIKKAFEADPRLFENNVDEDNKKIDEYNRNVEEYNKKIEND